MLDVKDMRVQEHIKLSVAATMVTLPWLKQDVWIPLASSVLIDVDHYLWHAMAHRTLSLRAAIRYFGQADPPQLPQSRLLHHPIVLGTLLVVALRTRSRILWLILAGLLYHVSLDLLHVTQMKSLKRRLNEQAQHICPQCEERYEELQLHTNHFAKNLCDRYNARHFMVLCPSCHEETHNKSGCPGVITKYMK
jgi:hypothetical protein